MAEPIWVCRGCLDVCFFYASGYTTCSESYSEHRRSLVSATASHLTALDDGNVLNGLVGRSPGVLDLGDDVHAFDDLAKDDVLAIEVGRAGLGRDDEELAAVGVGATVLEGCQ